MTSPTRGAGSIGCATDLQRAVTELGASASQEAQRWVIRRAKALGRMDLVPEEWRRTAPAVTESLGDPQCTLNGKLSAHNLVAPGDRRTTMAKLRAVYARGVETYTAAPRTGVTCDQFAQTRVTMFLHLLRTGEPRSATLAATDCDLLPRSHPLAEPPAVEFGT